MKRFFISLFFVLLSVPSGLFSQNAVSAIDSIANKYILETAGYLYSQKFTNVSLFFADKNSENIFKSAILKELSPKFKVFDQKKEDNLPIVEISTKSFSIKYEPIESSDDSLKRTIELKSKIITTNPDKSFSAPIEINYNSSSIVNYSEIIEVKNSIYSNNYSQKSPSKTFFEEYFEPIAVVGTAAIIIITLFSARSK